MRDFSEQSGTNASAAGADHQGSMIPLMAVGIYGVAALNGSRFQDVRTTYLLSEVASGIVGGCVLHSDQCVSCGSRVESCGCAGCAGCGGYDRSHHNVCRPEWGSNILAQGRVQRRNVAKRRPGYGKATKPSP
jgi:hypothetical protein